MWKGQGNNLSKALLLMQRRQKMMCKPRRSYHRPSFLISNSNNTSNSNSKPMQGQHQQLARVLMMPNSCGFSTSSSSSTMTTSAPISSLSLHDNNNNNNNNISLRRKHQQDQRRYFSDNLLGYSPMSKPSPIPSATATNNSNNASSDENKKRIPTATETTIGGVWAPTSAKRDKLAELKAALEEGQDILDDAATLSEKQDLYLADGLKLICKVSDTITATSEESDDFDNHNKEIEELSEFLLQQQQEMTTTSRTAGETESILNSDSVEKLQLEQVITKIVDKINMLLSHYPPGRCLREIRDFYDPDEIPSEEFTKFVEDLSTATTSTNKNKELNDNFQGAVIRFRLLLAKAAAEQIKDSWTILTKNSDGDIDRAAVQGQSLESEVLTISTTRVFKYIFANAAGTCEERVDAGWDLLDRDNDGLLDEEEMNAVVHLTLGPVQSAIQTVFEEALDDVDVDNNTKDDGNGATATEAPTTTQPPEVKGWRQRRRDAKTKKRMMKMISNSCKNHFTDEVEIDHRLRCIYAWAEKQHQDNKIDSVLVEEDGGSAGGGGGGILSGRKRHVELAPKISLGEFREVQKEHFTHIDRIGEEIMKSFREDLWVQQGKGRQNRELMRDCAAFLAVVSLIDYIILSL